MNSQTANTSYRLVMTCFEHQRLRLADFAYEQDFNYLLEQELPCFDVIIKQGKPQIVVKHYLAKIILPSGISLEVLPKVGNLDQSSHSSLKDTNIDNMTIDEALSKSSSMWQHQVQITRGWVAQMLIDISSHNLQKRIPAVNLDGATSTIETSSHNNSNSRFNNNDKLAPFMPPLIPSLTSSLNSATSINNLTLSLQNTDVNLPWYDWILNIASHKISDAASLLPKNYKMQAHNNPQAQGKINLRKQLKNNWHRPHYIYSEQAVFNTYDLLEQFLATGWQQLKWLTANSLKPSVQSDNHGHIKPDQYLQNLYAKPNSNGLSSQSKDFFKGIKTLSKNRWQSVYHQLQSEQPRWATQLSSAQKQTLLQALEWCWWVLNHLSSAYAEADMSSLPPLAQPMPLPALMINMNHAFEVWVLGRIELWMKQALPASKLMMQPKIDWLLLDEQAQDRSSAINNQTLTNQVQTIQQLVPDACISSANGKITHVIDIKYKTIDRIYAIKGSDWQQMAVYQQHLNAYEAWLIYPGSAGFLKPYAVTTASGENRDNLTVINKTINSKVVQSNLTNDDVKNGNDNDGVKTRMTAVPFCVFKRQLMID